MAASSLSPRDVVVGELRREYSLSPAEEWTLDAPGGSALYASAGYLAWEKDFPPGVAARVGEDYPQAWLEDLAEKGVDTSGIVILPHPLDLRSCIIQDGVSTWRTANPLPHLTRLGVSLPQGLVGLSEGDPDPSSRRQRIKNAILEMDIPPEYQGANGVHFCPLDYLSHNLLPAVFRQRGFSTLTLDPGEAYMDPTFFSDLPALVTGLTAFLPDEDSLRKLYKGGSTDLWEMAADLCHYGCELVVIKRGAGGQYLYAGSADQRWEIPAYPARVRNPYGVGDTFCGGFLAGYRKHFDPLEAVCYGNVAASLAVEGGGAFYPLDALPGLAEARLEAVRDSVRSV